MSAEYIIYCDESDEKGRHYSNFYGGILIRSRDIDRARQTIPIAIGYSSQPNTLCGRAVSGIRAEPHESYMVSQVELGTSHPTGPRFVTLNPFLAQ